MKRFMLFLALLLPMTATWAQKWTPKTNRQYVAETFVKVKVNVNGYEVGSDPSANVQQVAAFIGNECRAALTYPNFSDREDDGVENIFLLRVVGSDGSFSLASEIGKDITFKVLDDDGISYTFKTKATFSGDGDGNIPTVVLNLDKITEVRVPGEIDVRKKASEYESGVDVDVEPYISYYYGFDEYTPLNESSMEGSYQFTIDGRGSGSTYVTGTTITVGAEDAIDDNYLDYNLTAQYYDEMGVMGSTYLSTDFGLRIHIANTPVESITCDITSIDKFYAKDNLLNYLKSHVTILPAEANQNFHITVKSERGGDSDFSIPQEGGQYTVSITPDDEDYAGRPVQITVKVYVRPRRITASVSELDLHINDNVKTAFNNVLQFIWNGEDPGIWGEKTVEFSFDGTYVSSEGKALKVTPNGGAVATATLVNGVTSLPGDARGEYTSIRVNITSALTKRITRNVTDYVRNGEVANDSPVLIEVNNPGAEAFDENSLRLTFQGGTAPAEVMGVYVVSSLGSTTTYGFKIKPTRVCTQNYYDVYYGEEGLTTLAPGQATSPWYINVSAVQSLVKGWNWVSFNVLDAGSPAMADVFTLSDIKEARTQDALAINDARMGLMGDLTNVDPTKGMMKVYATKATTTKASTNTVLSSYTADYEVWGGFNWVNNPYEFDIPAASIADFFMYTVSDGDAILTKDGFATYSSSQEKWLATTGFALRAGQGMILYAKNNGTSILRYNPRAAAPRAIKRRAVKTKSMEVFSYDANAFADNMPIIATVEGLEDADMYGIGVFVDGECRGYGEFVEEAGLMFINAVGKRNEKLSFKLINNETEEMIDITDQLSFTTMQGTLSEPVVLHMPEAVTGIQRINGAAEGKTFDLSGRQVQNARKGIFIVDGKKVIK